MQSSWQERARPKPKSRARARGRCTEKQQDESALAPSHHEWTRRVPLTFESSPSKSIADFPSDEKLASATPAVTSELEAKLRQRMLKCEGKDCLYPPQVSKVLDQPSSTPARLKLTGGSPKTELPSETTLVDELELTASYQRCTQAQDRGCFARSRMRARKRSSPHLRRGEIQGVHHKASMSGRRSPQAASQRRRGRPSTPAAPTLRTQSSDDHPSISTPTPTAFLPDNKVFGGSPGGSQDCRRQNEHGVPTFALDDVERDAVQECHGSPVRSRSMGSPDTNDPGVDEDQGMSIEQCLFDLVNHVPPDIAQKIGIVLQHLHRGQPDSVLQEEGDLSLKPPTLCLQEDSGFGDCQGRLDPEGLAVRRLEGEARDAEEQARLCASELLRERVVWSQELAESRACTTWLEQSGCAAESRAEVEVSRMVAELELLHTRCLGEQAQLHGLRARLEEAEWQCKRHLNETRTSSNEAVTWRQRADDMERRLQESQQQGRLCFEELSKSRDYQHLLQMECAAETRRAAQATSNLEELQSMNGQRVRDDVPCIRKFHTEEDQRAVSTACAEERGGTWDAFRMPARQGEGGTSGLIPRRRGTQLTSQSSRAAERELRSELALALAEVDRQSKLRKVADMLNEKNSCEHNEMEAELAKAVSNGAALRCELRGEEEMLRQEKIRTEALNAHLQECGPKQHSPLPQSLNSRSGAVHSAQELSSPVHDQGVMEKGHARRPGRLRKERERRCWADSDHVGLAVERQALSGWLAAASADCLRAREQEAHLAGELATTRSRLEQEEEQLQVERLQLLELTCEAPPPLCPDSDLLEARERAMELWAAAAMEQWLSHSSGCSRSPSPGASSTSQPSPRPSCTASHPDLSSQSPAAPKPAGSQPPRPSSSRRADLLKRQQLQSKSQEMLRLEECCKAVSLEMTAQTQALAESETQRQELNSHTQATVLEATELWRAMGLRAVAHEKEFWQAEMLRERLEEKATLMVREAEARAEAAASHTRHVDDHKNWQCPPDRTPQCRPPPSFGGEALAALREPL